MTKSSQLFASRPTSNPLTTEDNLFSPGAYRRVAETAQDGLICCGLGLMALVAVVFQLSSVGFLISGIVLLVEEYSSIPVCAHSYQGWSIAMTVLFGLSATSSNGKSDGANCPTSRSEVAGMAAMVALLTGLISGLGYHKVWQAPAAGCDLSSISHLRTWTLVIIIYYAVLCGGSLLVMLGACLGRCRTRSRPSLRGLDAA